MGEAPDWYGLLQAAKYLGVPPWDLMEAPAIWRTWAYQASNAESQAQKQKDAQERRKSGK